MLQNTNQRAAYPRPSTRPPSAEMFGASAIVRTGSRLGKSDPVLFCPSSISNTVRTRLFLFHRSQQHHILLTTFLPLFLLLPPSFLRLHIIRSFFGFLIKSLLIISTFNLVPSFTMEPEEHILDSNGEVSFIDGATSELSDLSECIVCRG